MAKLFPFLAVCLIYPLLISCSSSGSGSTDTEPEPDPGEPVMADISDATISLQLGDVNGDGRPDLAVGNETPDIYIYLNQGGISPFQNVAPIRLSQPQSGGPVHLADFDGDRRPDLVLAQLGGPLEDRPVLFFRNRGQAPWFSEAEPLLSPAEGSGRPVIAGGDVDGDLDLDLVTAHGYNTGGVWDAHDTIFLFLNTGNAPVFPGQTTQQIHEQSTFSQDVRAASIRDFTGDGAADILVARGSGEEVDPRGCLFLVGNGAGSFAFNGYLCQEPGSYGAMAVDDLDSDGDPDLVLSTFSSFDHPQYEVFTFLNGGNGQNWVANKIFSTDQQPITCLTLADFNGDGRLDLFVGVAGISRILFDTGLGLPFQDAPQILVGEADSSLQAVVAGDVDGDNQPDLVLGRWLQPNIVVRNADLRDLFPQ